MKKTFLYLLLAFALTDVSAQMQFNNGFGTSYNGLEARKFFNIPSGPASDTSALTQAMKNALRPGAIFYDSVNNIRYIWRHSATQNYWGVDTASSAGGGGGGGGVQVDTIFVTPIGVKAGMKQVLFAVNGNLRVTNFGDGYGTKVQQQSDSLTYYDIDTTQIAYKQWIINQYGVGTGGIIAGFDGVLAVNQNLTANRISGFDGFNWEIDGTSNTEPTVHVVQSGTAPAIEATALTTGSTGMRSIVANGNAYDAIATTGTGYNATVTTGNGIYVSMTDGSGGIFISNSTSANQSQTMLYFEHATIGTAAPGIGSNMRWASQDASGGLSQDGEFGERLYTTTAGNKGSQFYMNVATSGTVSTAITFDGLGGVSATGTNGGGNFTGGSTGVFATSAGIPIVLNQSSTSTNTVLPGLYLERQGAYSAGAIGIGTSINWNVKDGLGSLFNSGNIANVVTDVTHLAQYSDYVFTLAQNGLETNVMRIVGKTSSLRFPEVSLWVNAANNSAAVSAGLTTGDLYRNGDVVQIVH